jgi:hypothetical protein
MRNKQMSMKEGTGITQLTQSQATFGQSSAADAKTTIAEQKTTIN